MIEASGMIDSRWKKDGRELLGSFKRKKYSWRQHNLWMLLAQVVNVTKKNKVEWAEVDDMAGLSLYGG